MRSFGKDILIVSVAGNSSHLNIAVDNHTSPELATGSILGPVSDEVVTGASFGIDIRAGGVTVKSCIGDGSDVECKLPLGVGSLTLKVVARGQVELLPI